MRFRIKRKKFGESFYFGAPKFIMSRKDLGISLGIASIFSFSTGYKIGFENGKICFKKL
jgi:hypothetical protein